MTLVMYAMVAMTTPSVEVTQALPIIEKSTAVIKSPAIPQVPYGQECPCSGRMLANLITWSVGSVMPSPGTVPAESKSPSLTWNLELQLHSSGLQ